MKPKIPKRMTAEEWFEIIKDNSTTWSEQLAVIDAQVRDALFTGSDDLPDDLMLLSAFFYASYLNHYITSLVTDSRVGMPAEILEQYVEISQEIAEKAVEETFGKQNVALSPDLLDPEDRINMPGGEA